MHGAEDARVWSEKRIVNIGRLGGARRASK
jgi:hypothetical protein